jgi:hypothetical protein
VEADTKRTTYLGKATIGSSGEAEKAKKAKLETTSAPERQATRSACRGKRTTAVEMAVQAATAMTAAMAVLAVQGAGQRGLAEAGRRGF